MISNFLTPSIEDFTRAHQGTSWTPERRGEHGYKEYEEYMTDTYAELATLAHSEPQKAALAENWLRFQKKHYELERAYLYSHSNVVSSMIAGPSGFPVRQMNKRADWAHKHLQRLLEYRSKALKAIRRAIEKAATPEQKDNREYRRLSRAAAHCVGILKGIEKDKAEGKGGYYDRSAFTTSLFGKLKRALDNGHVDIVRRVLDDLKALETQHLNKPVFTSRHKIWGLVEKGAAATPREASTGTEPVIKGPGFEIENNHDAERVQILFDDKPSYAVRTMLKGNGWRWSPRYQAWQRKNTEAGLINSVTMAENITKAAA